MLDSQNKYFVCFSTQGFLVEVLYTFNVYIAILYLNFVGKFFSIQPMLRGHSLILFNIENIDNEQPNW